MKGPSGGGPPIETALVYRVALGDVPVDELVDGPREVRVTGTSRPLTNRQAAQAMQTLAAIANVFRIALPPEKQAELREALSSVAQNVLSTTNDCDDLTTQVARMCGTGLL